MRWGIGGSPAGGVSGEHHEAGIVKAHPMSTATIVTSPARYTLTQWEGDSAGKAGAGRRSRSSLGPARAGRLDVGRNDEILDLWPEGAKASVSDLLDASIDHQTHRIHKVVGRHATSALQCTVYRQR